MITHDDRATLVGSTVSDQTLACKEKHERKVTIKLDDMQGEMISCAHAIAYLK